ncbi:MAG: nucleotidyltransferase domain-containing protein [Candidatus Nezhaarchaeales archaeon]
MVVARYSFRRGMAGLNDYAALIEEYLKLLKDRYGDQLVSLSVFGSVVRGEAGEGSDLDLLAVIEGLREDVGSRLKEVAEVKLGLKAAKPTDSCRQGGYLF